MRKQPKYRRLVIGLFAAIVIVTSSSPLGLMETVGVIGSAVILVVTAYQVTERKIQLLVAVALGASALLPIAWFRLHPEGLPLRLARGIYVLDLLFWLLFTLTTAIIVFRGILTAQRVRANEVFGAIYVYLLIGVMYVATMIASFVSIQTSSRHGGQETS